MKIWYLTTMDTGYFQTEGRKYRYRGGALDDVTESWGVSQSVDQYCHAAGWKMLTEDHKLYAIINDLYIEYYNKTIGYTDQSG